MRVPDWLKTAVVAKKSGLHAQICFRRIKNRVICERFKYAKFHFSFWECKGNNFFNLLVSRKHYLLVKVQVIQKGGRHKKKEGEKGAQKSVLQKKKEKIWRFQKKRKEGWRKEGARKLREKYLRITLLIPKML